MTAWDHHGSAMLGRVTTALLEAAGVRDGDRVVDLGCGTGQISLPLAERGAEVLAVDVSPAMITRLLSQAEHRGLTHVAGLALSAENLRLPPGCADLVVSSYALHHLRDADKERVITAAFEWLRPGGRLIVADMMFGRGFSRRDREIIASKVRVLARRGPGGWWRIVKNAARYQFRLQERPVSMSTWTSMLTGSGFAAVTARPIAAEAGLVTGTRPAAGRLPGPGERGGEGR
jgi:ubiquinone/menaquinone biosynthesis C-methylase UbiE